MDSWAWEQLEPWRQLRVRFAVGPLFCVIHGSTAGRNWEAAAARRKLGRTAAAAGVRRRFAPHRLRHEHAIELAHEGVPLLVIQRQPANLGITSIYLQGIDSSEILPWRGGFSSDVTSRVTHGAALDASATRRSSLT